MGLVPHVRLDAEQRRPARSGRTADVPPAPWARPPLASSAASSSAVLPPPAPQITRWSHRDATTSDGSSEMAARRDRRCGTASWAGPGPAMRPPPAAARPTGSMALAAIGVGLLIIVVLAVTWPQDLADDCGLGDLDHGIDRTIG